MAFTAELSQPGGVSGSIPNHQSGAAAIGGALSGLSDLIGMGLKASQDAREKRVTNTLEQNLNPIVDSLKPQTTVPLVGEAADGDAAKSTATYKNLDSQMGKFNQALEQSPDRRPEVYARAATVLQQAISENPRFSEELRKRATEVLGFNPTAEVLALEADHAKAAEAEHAQLRSSITSQGLSNGVLKLKTDGSGEIDFAGTAASLQALKQKENESQLALRDVEIQKAKAELANGKPLTAEQIKNGRQSAIAPFFDQIFNGVTGAATSQMEQFFKTNAAVTDPIKQEELLRQAFDPAEQAFWSGFNNAKTKFMSDGSMVPEDFKSFADMYKFQFDQIKEHFKGGFGNAEAAVRMVGELNRDNKVWADQNLGVVSKIIGAFGPNAQPLVQQAISAAGEGRTSLVSSMVNALNNFGPTQQLDHLTKVANGAASTEDIKDVPSKKGQLALQGTSIDNNVKSILKGDVSGMIGFGNVLNDFAKIGSQESDPDSLASAAGFVVNPSALAAFDKYSTVNPTVAKSAGGWIGALAARTAMKNMQALSAAPNTNAGPEGAYYNREGRAQLQAGSTNQTVSYDVQYNAQTGQVEIKPNLPNDYQGLLPRIPQGLTDRVRLINQSLDAVVHLKDYGNDQIKNADDALLKLGVAKKSGISIIGEPEEAKPTTAKGKQSYDKVPGELGSFIDTVASATGLDPQIAHAFAMEESSGGKDLPGDISVVGKGSVNPFQVAPDTAKALGMKSDNPQGSVIAGVSTINQLLARYEGQPNALEKTAIAYIAGPGHVDEFMKNPDKFPNTKIGVRRILKSLGEPMASDAVSINVVD